MTISAAQISYSLLEDRSGDHQFFHIDPEMGFIYTQTVFDRETKSSYLLEVQSVDGQESARPGKHGQPNSGKRGWSDQDRCEVVIQTLLTVEPQLCSESINVNVVKNWHLYLAIKASSTLQMNLQNKLREQLEDGYVTLRIKHL